MANHPVPTADEEEGPLLARTPLSDDSAFDITAMIDLVFMMNIYFMVTSMASMMAEIDLAPAQHAVAADPESCVIVTLMAPAAKGPAQVFIGEGTAGEALVDIEDQQQQVKAAVEAGMAEGKTGVMIKAEKGVLYRDVSRIAAAASSFENVKLFMAVHEFE